MAEQSGFFDAHLVDGEYDRAYLAESFAKYFASFIGNGIFAGKSSELTVRQKSAADMSVRVFAGQGWINGYWYENTDELSLAIDIADGVLNRIDIIVLRWSSVNRSIHLAVKKGNLATKPIAPIIQRDADVYELKLAEISIKAGTTGITQINISDTRLDSAVCGYVHGVVEQFDAQDFGEQLTAFINEFMINHEAWSAQFKADSAAEVDAQVVENQDKINKLISDGQTAINGVVNTGTSNINKLITDKTTEVNQVVSTGQANIANVVSNGEASINRLLSDKTAEANQVISQGQKNFSDLDNEANAWFNAFKLESEEDVTTLITRLQELVDDNDLASLNEKIVALQSLAIEHITYKGCYYRIVNSETEWINAPNEPGIEYKTTERWNGKPVYQKTFYVGALSNKTVMGIDVQADWNKIISIDGFAQSDDDMYFYPFPIILNGLTPAAAIVRVESNGDNEGVIVIQVNEDLTYLKAYITIKYTKE